MKTIQEKRQDLLQERKELVKGLLEMRSKDRMKSIMICIHNTILALRANWSNEITHVVDTEYKSNLVMIQSVNEYLSVPRYEPKTAKAWLKEDTEFNYTKEQIEEGYTYTKITLSEKELRKEVQKHFRVKLSFNKDMRQLKDDSLQKLIECGL